MAAIFRSTWRTKSLASGSKRAGRHESSWPCRSGIDSAGMASNRIPAPAGSVDRTVSRSITEMIEMIRKRVGVMNKDDKKKEPTDIVKHEPTKLVDNFEGWDDGVEGEELPENLELCPVDVLRVVQKWHDQQPIETIILEPHQKFPDIKRMNEEAPKEEWVEGPDDKMHGPYQAQHGRQRPH